MGEVSFFDGSGDVPADGDEAASREQASEERSAEEQAALEQASLERVEAGGIPLSAERRLRELTGDAPFTSTLSVAEFALLNELGPRSLGQVLGASVHQVGWQYLPGDAAWGGTVICPLETVAHAWDQARRRSFDRLAEEATLLGADAVIGVKVRRGAHDWAAGSVDYTVTGTAIRLPNSSGERWPGLSDLSVQDYWKLVSAGYTPAGLCATTAAFFVSMSQSTAFGQWMTSNQNQELVDYTRGFSVARESAVRALRSQADAVGADGLVGVSLEHRITRESLPTLRGYGFGNPGGGGERAGIVIVIQAVGTAITRAAARTATPTRSTLRVSR